MTLMAVTAPSRWQIVGDEVQRRYEVIAKTWLGSDIRIPPDETPRCAAIKSVLNDVCLGRL